MPIAIESNAQILMANGSLKNVNRLTVGDKVLDMRMTPVSIASVAVVKDTALQEVRYNNWYAPSYVTPETEVLLFTPPVDSAHLPEIKWSAASNLRVDTLLGTDLAVYGATWPEQFTACPGFVESTELGEFIGLYAGYGSIADMTIVEFKFGLSRDLVDNVLNLVKKLFNVEMTVTKSEFAYTLTSDNERLIEMCSEFGPRIGRIIPRKYWIRHTAFLKGVLQGLLEYDPKLGLNRFIAINREMATFFTIACAILGIVFDNDTPRLADNPSLLNVFPLFIDPKKQGRDLAQVSMTTPNAVVKDAIAIETNGSTESVIVNGLVLHVPAQTIDAPTVEAPTASMEQLSIGDTTHVTENDVQSEPENKN